MNDIYALTPINKTAALVTNQSGCSDDFYNNSKEELELLGKKKQDLMAHIRHLKEKLGIDGRENGGANTKYPRHIINNPIYKTYLSAKKQATELDNEIVIVRKKLNGRNETITNIMKNIIRKEYPDIYWYAFKKAKEKYDRTS